jgi:hypothetical protein
MAVILIHLLQNFESFLAASTFVLIDGHFLSSPYIYILIPLLNRIIPFGIEVILDSLF